MHPITTPEIIRSLIGAWRIFLRDPAGLSFFKFDIAAFWKSFWCAAVILPGYLIIVALRVVELDKVSDAPLDLMRFGTVEIISYVIGWVIWPLIMLEAVKVIDRQVHYLRYIVVYNWIQAPGLLFALLLISVEATDLFPEKFLTIIGLGYYVWIIIVHVFVFKITMNVKWGMALPFAIGEIIVSIIIISFKLSLIGVL